MKLHRILIWFIVTFYVTYAFCLNTAAAVFSDAIQRSLHLSATTVSMAFSAYILSFAISQIPAGYILDRYNPRWVVSTGILVLAFGNYLNSIAHGPALLIFSNIIQGFGGSFAFIGAGVLISNWYNDKQFPIMFGLTQSISCILSGVFHYQMVDKLKTISWDQIYHYLSAMGILLFIASVIFIRQPKSYKKTRSIELFDSVKKVLCNKQILLCTAAAAFSFGVTLAYAGYWYMDIQKFYHVNLSDAFIIGGMIFAGIGIGTPALGWISNKEKSRKGVIHCSLVLGTMCLLLGIYLPHFNGHSYLVIKSVSFLIGFFLSGSMLLYTVVSENTTNASRGVALSVTNTGVFVMYTLMLFFPRIFMVHSKNLFFTYLWIFPFMILISILISYFIKETYHGASTRR